MVDYYKAPSNKIFAEIKKEAIKIWKTYDNTYGYANSKIDRIKDLKNISGETWEQKNSSIWNILQLYCKKLILK